MKNEQKKERKTNTNVIPSGMAHRALLKNSQSAQPTQPDFTKRRPGSLSRSILAMALFALFNISASATITVTGLVSQITSEALETKITFTPAADILLLTNGLSAGPAKTISSAANGGFTNTFNPGTYLVRLPLVSGRNAFTIAVPHGNGIENITNLIAAPWTYEQFVNTIPAIDGIVQTNISVSAVTNAGNMAYSNATPFLTVVTNAAAQQAAVATNDLYATLNTRINNATNAASLPSSVNATNGFAAGLAAGTVNVLVTNNSPYRYLSIVPVSLSSGYESIGLKYSGNGSNWTTLMLDVGRLGTTNLLYTPAITFWANRFWCAYDPYSVTGVTTTQSNVWGLAWSTNLLNWTRQPLVTNTVVSPARRVYMNSFYQESGTLYLYLSMAARTGSESTDVYVAAASDNTLTNFGSWTRVATNLLDCSVGKIGSTYFMVGSDASSVCNIWTNTTGPASQFYHWRQDVLPSPHNGSLKSESPHLLNLGNGVWRMYVQMNPGTVQKTYYFDTTDFVTFTTGKELVEDGIAPGRMLPIELSSTNQALLAMAVQASTQNRPIVTTYFLETVDPTTNAISRPVFLGGAAAATITYDIDVVGLDAVSLLPMTGSAQLKVGAYQGSQVGGMTYILNQKTEWFSRPTNRWGVLAITQATNGVSLSVTSAPAGYLRWKITETINAVTPPVDANFQGSMSGAPEPSIVEPLFSVTSFTPAGFGYANRITNGQYSALIIGQITLKSGSAGTGGFSYINVIQNGVTNSYAPTGNGLGFGTWYIPGNEIDTDFNAVVVAALNPGEVWWVVREPDEADAVTIGANWQRVRLTP